jgi:hypothetical protein
MITLISPNNCHIIPKILRKSSNISKSFFVALHDESCKKEPWSGSTIAPRKGLFVAMHVEMKFKIEPCSGHLVRETLHCARCFCKKNQQICSPSKNHPNLQMSKSAMKFWQHTIHSKDLGWPQKTSTYISKAISNLWLWLKVHYRLIYIMCKRNTCTETQICCTFRKRFKPFLGYLYQHRTLHHWQRLLDYPLKAFSDLAKTAVWSRV